VTERDKLYREFIDGLVRDCQAGQGQIGKRRPIADVWNVSATPSQIPEQYPFNELLARLAPTDREVLGQVLEEQFMGGCHQALARLHESGIEPFDKAYEGTPFHDFVGRLDDWEWPTSRQRT
jgi:hypothetical protein